MISAPVRSYIHPYHGIGGFPFLAHCRSWGSLILFFMATAVYGKLPPEPEQVPLTLQISTYADYDLVCLVGDQKAFVPLQLLFDILKIKHVASQENHKLTGFLMDEKKTYEINKYNNHIVYDGTTYAIPPTDLKATPEDIYLETSYLGTIFGLRTIFDYRNLSLTLHTELELPFIKEKLRERLYAKLGRTAHTLADTIIKRDLSGIQGGVLDWALTSTQVNGGKNRYAAQLGLGGTLLGGEVNMGLNYNHYSPFDLSRQSFRWRFVDNEAKGLREFVVGSVDPRTVSTYFAPVYGAKITSIPTLGRQTFGTYNIRDRTEPGWLVELYVNETLLSYQKADAAGLYSFEVPLIYGSSRIKLVFVGPWGEERIHEKEVKIPFGFVPKGTFEYTVTGGKLMDNGNGYLLKGQFNYGLGQRITLGSGMEHLSNGNRGKPVPFTTASLRVGPKFILSGNHYFGVQSQFVLNYELPFDAQLQIDYTKFQKGQKAIFHNYREQRKMALYIPFNTKKITSLNRLSYSQISFPDYSITTAEWNASFFFMGVSSNISTSAVYRDNEQVNLYSNLAFTVRNIYDLTIVPQLRYDYTSKNLETIKLSFEKRIKKYGNATLFFERYFNGRQNYMGINLNLNLSYFQLSLSERHSKKHFSTTQSARGGILFDRGTRRLILNDTHNVGKGGVALAPFLDINANGRKDKKEPVLSGLKFRIDGGHRRHRGNGATVTLLDLEPYRPYFITVDPLSFDHIAWSIKNPNILVEVVPNQLKQIQIPVSVMGEVAGSVTGPQMADLGSMAGISVKIYNGQDKLMGKTTTATDGYFSYFGLPPGTYSVKIDRSHLRKLKLRTEHTEHGFTIKALKEGDYVDDIEFVLTP